MCVCDTFKQPLFLQCVHDAFYGNSYMPQIAVVMEVIVYHKSFVYSPAVLGSLGLECLS